MSEAPGDEGSLADGIFGAGHYRATEPFPKDFKPWHKPRKQFVRREQLARLVRRLYSQRPQEEPLRYLGLPGTDLIDLRYLYEQVCRDASRPLTFLGFNTEIDPQSSARIELDVSLHEVRRLPRVNEQSDVLHDDFRSIGNPASLAWKQAESLGPFDVVNIDLCGGVASDEPSNSQSIYAAMARLIALQSKNARPWLLLVATRIGHGMFDPEAEAELVARFRENVCSCDGFVEDCARHLHLDANTIDASSCSDAEYLNLMMIAMSKWLAKLVQASAPSRVELASAQGYRVGRDAACEDLVSLAMRFEPVIEPSPNPLSPTAPPAIDECEIAKAMLRRVASKKDIDALLAEDSGLEESLTVEMEHLLTRARYDAALYREWLESTAAPQK